jgi:hypothetical protein
MGNLYSLIPEHLEEIAGPDAGLLAKVLHLAQHVGGPQHKLVGAFGSQFVFLHTDTEAQ